MTTIRTCIRMIVSEVSVSREGIIISGPTAALENGISKGEPRLEATVPIFDREWCQKGKHTFRG